MSSKKQGSQFLKGLRNFRVPVEHELFVIEEYLISLDCPRALTVLVLLRNQEYQQLSELEFDPLHYLSVVELRASYAATKFLSKYSGFTRDLDLAKVAYKKFDDFELLCKQTNLSFRSLKTYQLYTGKFVWLHHAITRKISKILGEFDWDEFFSSPDWGPGASTLIKRRRASSAVKFQEETGITRDLHALLPTQVLEGYYPLWGLRLSSDTSFPTYQIGNRVTTVPKDSSTDRVIAIEPGLNLFFQSSVGTMIKKRLRRYGIDLRWQSRNQHLAYVGSKDSTLATVDLSSASDSIAIEVVRELLPPDWFEVMDACRSHYGTQEGRVRKWEKFSSMGNGFTFQLESLIFYAIACCCTEYLHISSSDVSAYGDDVIIPTGAFGLLQEVMPFYGFRINLKKSHFGSAFRESCGSHYYLGVDVKPIYLKDRLSSVLSVYRLANAIRRLSFRWNGSSFSCDSRFERVHRILVHKVPKDLRLWIPDGLGDGGFVCDFDKALPTRARNGIEGYRVIHVMEIGLTNQEERLGYLLAELWRLERRSRTDLPLQEALARDLQTIGDYSRRMTLKAIDNLTLYSSTGTARQNRVALPGSTKIRVIKSVIQQWRDLGPWL